jgi:hypothetical protein
MLPESLLNALLFARIPMQELQDTLDLLHAVEPEGQVVFAICLLVS